MADRDRLSISIYIYLYLENKLMICRGYVQCDIESAFLGNDSQSCLII